MSRIIPSNEALNLISSKITVYDENERRSIAYLLLEKLSGLKKSSALTGKVVVYNDDQVDELVEKINNFEPIQYIFEETEFYDKKIKVSPDVLIPRPETEQLVDIIIKENKEKKNLRVLDIGTGSGCIAIALAAHLPGAKVFGLDVNVRALKAAYHNAVLNKTKVIFFQHDLFSEENLPVKNIDIVIANPPYVTESEKEQMLPNVLNFEPEQALFVPDDDPLVFYRRILKKTSQHLSENAVLYFEINERYGQETIELFNEMGLKNCRIEKDLSGKDRFVIAESQIKAD